MVIYVTWWNFFLKSFCLSPIKYITRLSPTSPVNTRNKRVSYLLVNFALFHSHPRKPPFEAWEFAFEVCVK